jgi:hypothetical protein
MEKIWVRGGSGVRYCVVGRRCSLELQVMKSKNLVAALRRDVSFVWHALIAVVFIGFASLAVAAALFDLLAIHR